MINLCSYVALEVECVVGTDHSFQVFDCTANNKLISVSCSFDRQTPESCSFPLEVNTDRFGMEKHTPDGLFVDEFHQGKIVSFEFQLAERTYITNTLLTTTSTLSVRLLLQLKDLYYPLTEINSTCSTHNTTTHYITTITSR